MTKIQRASKAAALETWADAVDPGDLVALDTTELQQLVNLAAQREALEADLDAAVRRAREARRTWAEIGAMLGVSKQAAQRKYTRRIPAA